MSPSDRYPFPLRVLHWVVAGLVLCQVLAALVNATVYETAPNSAEIAVQIHISIGVLIFALMLLRAGLRMLGPLPVLPVSMSPGKRRLARATHLSLYVVLFSLPVTGWLKFAALGYPVTAFGFVPLPALEFQPDTARRARTAHDILALILVGLVGLHIIAALFHRKLAGQPVLARMGFGPA